MHTLDGLLRTVMENGASDLHVSPGLPPILRIDGNLTPFGDTPLTPEDVEQLLFSMLSTEQRRALEQEWEIDFSYGIHGVGRFRVNIYRETAESPRGLILVTGPTGSGKSTTLAAMINHINETRSEHILTVEDPIEFIHKSKKSVIHQRELAQDTRSFARALKSALREDPDIILVGEMRDLDTISLALTAAETGHLVMGTLHTSSAASTVDRIIDVFPEGQQQQVRMQLSNSLVAVFSQTLLPRLQPDGTKKGRIMAQEIMIVNNAIANLIREGKAAQIYSVLQTGSAFGMQTLETALKNLYKQKLVTLEDALTKTSRPDELKRMISM